MSDDRRVADANAAIEGPQETIASSAISDVDNGRPAASGRADAGQTLSGGDRTARRRHQIAQRCVDSAAERDAIASARDQAAEARDHAATVRDRALAARHAMTAPARNAASGAEMLFDAAASRCGTADRAAAAEGRVLAAADREQAAKDREQAARDRMQAQADRESLLQQLTSAETDRLTGAFAREAGVAGLEREMERARSTERPLAVACVDVLGLKAVNAVNGHAVGDELLRRTVRALRGHLRPDDLVVRLGGGEFLCTMPGAPIREVRRRFVKVHDELASDPRPCAIELGFAALELSDTAATLIERAHPHPAGPGRS